MVKIDDMLPHSQLWEVQSLLNDPSHTELVTFDAVEASQGKTIIIVGGANAFTQTCSLQHLPGFLELSSHFIALGVDEIWCISINDAYVLNAWGKQLNVDSKIRMISDGNVHLTSLLGLTRDLSSKGMGMRSQRYSMLVVDGVITILNIDPEGKYVVSDAQQLYIQLQGMLDNE